MPDDQALEPNENNSGTGLPGPKIEPQITGEGISVGKNDNGRPVEITKATSSSGANVSAHGNELEIKIKIPTGATGGAGALTPSTSGAINSVPNEIPEPNLPDETKNGVGENATPETVSTNDGDLEGEEGGEEDELTEEPPLADTIPPQPAPDETQPPLPQSPPLGEGPAPINNDQPVDPGIQQPLVTPPPPPEDIVPVAPETTPPPTEAPEGGNPQDTTKPTTPPTEQTPPTDAAANPAVDGTPPPGGGPASATPPDGQQPPAAAPQGQSTTPPKISPEKQQEDFGKIAADRMKDQLKNKMGKLDPKKFINNQTQNAKRGINKRARMAMSLIRRKKINELKKKRDDAEKEKKKQEKEKKKLESKRRWKIIKLIAEFLSGVGILKGLVDAILALTSDIGEKIKACQKKIDDLTKEIDKISKDIVKETQLFKMDNQEEQVQEQQAAQQQQAQAEQQQAA